jgi:hypothetical protein
MAWSDAYNYLRSGASRMLGQPALPADTGLPLGARIGSVVGIQQSPLLRAVASGALIAPPDAGEARIVAVSQLRLRQAGAVYRYYLATGDRDDREKFLQVYQDAGGAVREILYCTQLARVIPETAADQDAYTGQSGYGLGDRSYTLSRQQIDGAEHDLGLVFGADEGLDYWRDAGDPAAGFVPPYTGTEVRLDDSRGQTGLRQDLYFMPYVRTLRGGGQEYLLITTEILHSVNGDTRQRGIHVDFVIGIPVEQQRIVIQ